MNRMNIVQARLIALGVVKEVIAQLPYMRDGKLIDCNFRWWAETCQCLGQIDGSEAIIRIRAFRIRCRIAHSPEQIQEDDCHVLDVTIKLASLAGSSTWVPCTAMVCSKYGRIIKVGTVYGWKGLLTEWDPDWEITFA